MIQSQLLNDASTFILAAIPVGGFMAQATDMIPSGLANMTAGAFAMITAYFLWKHLEKKDKDQKEAQVEALAAKDDQIKALRDDLKEMKDVVLKEFQIKKTENHENS